MAENQQSGPQGQNQSGQSARQQQQQQKSQLSWGQPAAGAPAGGTGSDKKASPVSVSGGSSSSRTAGVFVAGLVVGLLIAWAWVDLRAPSNSDNASAISSSTDEFTVTQTQGSQTASDETGSSVPSSDNSGTQVAPAASDTSAAPSGATDASAAIVVASTQPAGSSVDVSSITSSEPVWAVVYEDDNGAPGVVLGAARFAASRSGSIQLLRSTLPNLTYFVGLVADTADHSYNLKVNAPVLGSDGKQVMAQFMAK